MNFLKHYITACRWCICVFIGFSASAVFADYDGGTGQPNDPYLICDANQMNEIGLNSGDWDKHFQLMADIDLSEFTGTEFNIIGDFPDAPFTGVFNGNGHTISNFTYTASSARFNFIGLFGYIQGANTRITDLGIIDPNICSEISVLIAGVLVGYIEDADITGCFIRGGTIKGGSHIGGLVGGNCGGTISNCYAETRVEAAECLGGLAGHNQSGIIYNCYSAGQVVGTVDTGALVGCDSSGTYINSFWDSTVNAGLTGVGNIPDPAGVIGEPTVNMQKSVTFVNANWDFVEESANGTDDFWRLCTDGTNYPVFAWQFPDYDFLCPDGVNMRDYAVVANQWQMIILTVDFAPGQGDGVIDFLDWAVFADAWQSEQNQPNWNPMCDVFPEGGDGKVNTQDMSVFAEQWLKQGSDHLEADIAPLNEKDDVVDILDLALIIENWLRE